MAGRKQDPSAGKARPPKKKPGEQDKPRREPPAGRDDPKDAGDPSPTTTERPRHKCACESTNSYFFTIGSVPGKRVILTVASKVQCDPGTPGNCFYEYTATAGFQKQQGQRWVPDNSRNAFVRKFAVKDPVNSTETPDRADQTSVTIGDWFPKAPQQEDVDVELKLVASVRGGWEREVKRKATLCVPKLDNPFCPES